MLRASSCSVPVTVGKEGPPLYVPLRMRKQVRTEGPALGRLDETPSEAQGRGETTRSASREHCARPGMNRRYIVA